jgi:hypothetical protein
MIVICPKCKDEGLKSTVQHESSMSTCMNYASGYYDEDGKWVVLPDGNTTTSFYKCSNLHDFTTSTQYGKTTFNY